MADAKPAPTEGPDSPRAPEWKLVRLEELGRLIWERRRSNGLTLEAAARQVGISLATLWRLERQRPGAKSAPDGRLPEPDTRTVSAVAHWLGVSAERFIDRAVVPATDAIVHHQGETTPDIIEAHLRADRALDEKSAAALARMFRLAYEQVQQLRPPTAQGEQQTERQ